MSFLVTGIALYFPNSFEVYLALRVLLGLVSVSVTYAGLILAIEFVDGKWRTSKCSEVVNQDLILVN